MSLDRDPNRFSSTLKGKTVVLAVTASISLYRVPDIIRNLRREGAIIRVGMSREAAEFISPEIMKWASENDVVVKITGDVEHITEFIGDRKNTMLLVCPASYNFIGKAASGISDDVPSLFFSFALGNGNPIVIAPVMHEGMMVNPINRENLEKLSSAGVHVVPPLIEAEKAKISESDKIIDYVSRAFHGHKLSKKKILIIGGRGEEKIDPVRSITNLGTGLTASWLARSAFKYGAEKVSFIGNTEYGVQDYVHKLDAAYMDEYEKSVEKLLGSEKYDAVINVASLPDFEIRQKFKEKLDSKEPLSIDLEPRGKLNEEVRRYHSGSLVVFKLTREISVDETRKAFASVKPDLVIFNSYSDTSVPFGEVSNSYSALTVAGETTLGKLSKPELSVTIMEMLSGILGGK